MDLCPVILRSGSFCQNIGASTACVHDDKKHSTIYMDFLYNMSYYALCVLWQFTQCAQEIVEVFSKKDHKGRCNHRCPLCLRCIWNSRPLESSSLFTVWLDNGPYDIAGTYNLTKRVIILKNIIIKNNKHSCDCGRIAI